MKCPYCGTYVSGDATVCPACHSPLDGVHAGSESLPRWCDNCGSLIPEGETRCPHCGMPYNRNPPTVAEVLDRRMGDVERELEADEDTHSMPRIESAIPPEPEDGYANEAAHEHLPRRRVVLVSALAAIVAVGGTALAITQPWNPNAYVTHALVDADTSMEGFPGFVQTLTGQDKSPSTDDDSSDSAEQEQPQTTYDKLKSAYDQLGDLSSRIDDNEKTLEAVEAGDESQRDSGSSDAYALSIELSNLISSLGTLDVADTPYADDLQHLITLGNYLRNRMDALSDAWAGTGSADKAQTWEQLFQGSYGNWAPQEEQE